MLWARLRHAYHRPQSAFPLSRTRSSSTWFDDLFEIELVPICPTDTADDIFSNITLHRIASSLHVNNTVSLDFAAPQSANYTNKWRLACYWKQHGIGFFVKEYQLPCLDKGIKIKRLYQLIFSFKTAYRCTLTQYFVDSAGTTSDTCLLASNQTFASNQHLRWLIVNHRGSRWNLLGEIAISR